MTNYFAKPAKEGGRKVPKKGGYRKLACKYQWLLGLQRAGWETLT